MNERINPFGDLGDFVSTQVKQKLPIDSRAVIDEVAEENNFPSRQPARQSTVTTDQSSALRSQRRYTTGRNKQINIKATDQTIDRLHRIADKLGVPLGEVLARALQALDENKAQ